jgi:rare lipoprotein A
MARGGFRLGLGRKLGIANMSIDRACTLYVDIGTDRTQRWATVVPAAGKVIRLLAIVLGAASLAACAQSSVVSQKSEIRASRVASLDHDRTTSPMIKRRVAAVRKHTRFASRKDTGNSNTASHGMASFYTEGTKTASGEKFNTMEMTAAHPTLPFGTKLRVTDVSSGKSVTVRVNDRGPYVNGRVVDVSYSAANALGMVGKGVANVKLDVVD